MTSSAGSKRSRCSASSPAARRDESGVAGTLAVLPPAEPVHPSHQLGVEPDPRREAEAPAVHPPGGDRPRAAGLQRRRDLARRRREVARQAERAREHIRPAAGQEAERDAARRAVQDLVEAAVAGEDDHASPPPAASSVPWPGRSVSSVRTSRHPLELRLDGAHASLGDGARVRVHDQDDFHKLPRG